MALGFIKKVFSFGKDKVEETEAPAEEAQPASVPSDEAIARPEPAEPAQEATESETPATAVELQPEATPPADETRPEPEAAAVAEPEVAIEESVEPGAAAPESPTEPAAAEPAEDRQAAPEPEPVESEAEPPEPEVEAREEAPAAPEKAEPELPSEPEPPVETPEPQPAAEPTRRVTVSQAVEEVPTSLEEPEAVTPAPRASWFERLRKGLSRSSEQLGQNISGIFTRRKLDEDTLEELEDVLIQSDLGIETAMRVTDTLSKGRYGRDVDVAEVRKIMATEIETVLEPVARPLELDLSYKPHVILVVGVNGTGKTTTIGKLAAKLARGGLKVTLAAGDTFRAAAIEQLHIWGERTGSTVVSTKLGADAAGLAFGAWEKAKANGSDVLIIDTAGRLQNKTELMEELAKIVRVLGKHDPDAPHTVLQTLDATTGQNALNQVEIFRNVAGVNGLVMTKLDGTARGGILVAISAKHKLPVYFIGVGEGVDDLEPFSAKDFASAIAGTAQ